MTFIGGVGAGCTISGSVSISRIGETGGMEVISLTVSGSAAEGAVFGREVVTFSTRWDVGAISGSTSIFRAGKTVVVSGSSSSLETSTTFIFCRVGAGEERGSSGSDSIILALDLVRECLVGIFWSSDALALERDDFFIGMSSLSSAFDLDIERLLFGVFADGFLVKRPFRGVLAAALAVVTDCDESESLSGSPS